MKAITTVLFVSIVVAPWLGEAAARPGIDDPAEALFVVGTPLELDRSRVSPDGNLRLQRATGRAMTYRGNVTVTGPTGAGRARIHTWMELHLRERNGGWTGRFQSGYSTESRLTGTLNTVERSGIDSLVFRASVHEWVCPIFHGHGSPGGCHRIPMGQIELTLLDME